MFIGNNPELARVSGLDIIVPVQGFKRCVDRENGYGEFSCTTSVSFHAERNYLAFARGCIVLRNVNALFTVMSYTFCQVTST
jgi:hypothetical protein